MTWRTSVGEVSLQTVIHLLMSEWHIWLRWTAGRDSHSHHSSPPEPVSYPIKLLQLKVEASPASILNPEQRFQENLTKNPQNRKKNIQFQIFQYYMITLRFPFFQSDQSVYLFDSTSLMSLTEESCSAKTLAAWVNNSVLVGAETDRLCGSSVSPLTLLCHFPSEDTLHVFWGLGLRGGSCTSADYCFSLLCLSAFTLT